MTELTEGERKENDSWCHDVDIIPGFGFFITSIWASLMAQLVKNPPTMRETWVQSLVWEDPLEKGKATHSSILA